MGQHGPPWFSMCQHESAWVKWVNMGQHGSAWASMGQHGSAWISMGQHESTCATGALVPTWYQTAPLMVWLRSGLIIALYRCVGDPSRSDPGGNVTGGRDATDWCDTTTWVSGVIVVPDVTCDVWHSSSAAWGDLGRQRKRPNCGGYKDANALLLGVDLDHLSRQGNRRKGRG